MRDTAQFEQIVHLHQARVFRMLALLVNSREHLEDLAQEVFMRLFRGMEHFRGEAQVSTYLYRIVVNVAQDEWKRVRRDDRRTTSLDVEYADGLHTTASQQPDAEHQLQQKQVWAIVNGALAELSREERTALTLYHQEDCTYQQIALALDLPVGTVRTHLHRGRQKLRERVRERMNA